MKKNIIILTPGLSGSSLLTSLLGKAGYWFGEETKKISYDTFENDTLVDININILERLGFSQKNIINQSVKFLQTGMQKQAGTDDNIQCYNLIKDCGINEPWIWKDPRLCYTIHFWSELMDIKNIKFILMTRDLKQVWTGTILRADYIIPYRKLQVDQEHPTNSAKEFLSCNSLDHLHVTFEDILLDPEKTLQNLNQFLSTELTHNDLLNVYRGKLYSKRWNARDFIKACFKYSIHRIYQYLFLDRKNPSIKINY